MLSQNQQLSYERAAGIASALSSHKSAVVDPSDVLQAYREGGDLTCFVDTCPSTSPLVGTLAALGVSVSYWWIEPEDARRAGLLECQDFDMPLQMASFRIEK